VATYGELRYRVLKEAPGVDLALLDGYFLDRYTAILDRLKWSRLEVDWAFTTTAPYSSGTVTLTAGQTTVALAGGTFDASMTGRILRAGGSDESYEFTFATAASGQLDRPYAGDTGAYTYQLLQSVYALPRDARIVTDLRPLSVAADLTRTGKVDLDHASPTRPAIGTPCQWALAPDANTDPPVMQIELYPVPDAAYSFALSYAMEAPGILGSGTTLLPWLRPSALVAGATADALNHLENYAGGDRQELKYERYLGDMVRTECANRGPQRIRLASWLTRDNVQRAIRSSSNRTGPRLP
jgi:hypothetical protein